MAAVALNRTLDICRRFKAELSVIHVIPNADFNPLGMSEEKIKAEEEKFRQTSIQRLETFYQQFDFEGIKIDFKYPWGKPSRVMLDLIEDFDYDLMVLGATGESILKQVLLGSTTERILRHVPCSLLVAR